MLVRAATASVAMMGRLTRRGRWVEQPERKTRQPHGQRRWIETSGRISGARERLSRHEISSANRVENNVVAMRKVEPMRRPSTRARRSWKRRPMWHSGILRRRFRCRSLRHRCLERCDETLEVGYEASAGLPLRLARHCISSIEPT